jgi:hypothetical protein
MMTKKQVYEFCQEHLPNCGCGAPDETMALIRSVLIACKGSETWDALKKLLPGVYSEPNNFAEWFLLYVLDHCDLIDHGTTVRCPWLTTKGESFVAAIESYPDWSDLMTGNIGFESDPRKGTINLPVYTSLDRKYVPVPGWELP